MVVSYSGIAGKRGYNPTKIVLHNDAGSQNANAAFYKKWLEGRNPELGFAHYYVASDGTFQAELDTNKAWHCGNTVGNRDYIGIEICQSNGDEATFKANEQKAFKLAYDLCKKYGIAITVDNFPLHKELSATSCPFRSFELHGRSNNAVKQYFVEQVVKAGGQVVKPTPTPSKPGPTPSATGWIAENGTFILGMPLPLTVNDSGSGALIANLPKGSAIKYDAFRHANGYVWIRQPRGNGYGYMATGYSKNGKRQDYWGTFK